MSFLFYTLNLISILAAFRVITQIKPVHALVYLIIFLVSISCMFFLLGAELEGALEIIIYAGAIMVMFLFVIMTININSIFGKNKFTLLYFIKNLLVPLFFSIILLVVLIISIINTEFNNFNIEYYNFVSIKDISKALFGKYALTVELASLILLAGIIIVILFNKEEHKKKQ